MDTEVIAIFDIGKTNKKFFLFDKDYQVKYETVTYIEPTVDDDGEESEDITKLSEWIEATLATHYQNKELVIKGVNISAYGASFVHLGEDGKPVLPLYNYLKKLPEQIIQKFLEQYGPEEKFAVETAAPIMYNMLNSGLQLYWLKYTKPQLFNKIKYSLHLPQYCSYLVNNVMCSEISSIGCHTALWDFQKRDYHRWVYNEKITNLFSPTISVFESTLQKQNGSIIETGTGVHDSSAALFPYLDYFNDPFVLISTGTWSVTMNPFSHDPLQLEDINNDCLNYISVKGSPVRSSRLFLGNEHHHHVQRISKHFNVSEEAFQNLAFNENLADNIKAHQDKIPHSTHETSQLMADFDLDHFNNFTEAYYYLVSELAALQAQSAKVAIGSANITKAILTGGFYNNEIFLKMLATEFKSAGIELYIADLKRASAVGAAMVLKLDITEDADLQKLFKLRKIAPII